MLVWVWSRDHSHLGGHAREGGCGLGPLRRDAWIQKRGSLLAAVPCTPQGLTEGLVNHKAALSASPLAPMRLQRIQNLMRPGACLYMLRRAFNEPQGWRAPGIRWEEHGGSGSLVERETHRSPRAHACRCAASRTSLLVSPIETGGLQSVDHHPSDDLRTRVSSWGSPSWHPPGATSGLSFYRGRSRAPDDNLER